MTPRQPALASTVPIPVGCVERGKGGRRASSISSVSGLRARACARGGGCVRGLLRAARSGLRLGCRAGDASRASRSRPALPRSGATRRCFRSQHPASHDSRRVSRRSSPPHGSRALSASASCTSSSTPPIRRTRSRTASSRSPARRRSSSARRRSPARRPATSRTRSRRAQRPRGSRPLFSARPTSSPRSSPRPLSTARRSTPSTGATTTAPA